MQYDCEVDCRNTAESLILVRRPGCDPWMIHGTHANYTDLRQIGFVAHWLYTQGIRSFKYGVFLLPHERRQLREAFEEMLREGEDYSAIANLAKMSKELET